MAQSNPDIAPTFLAGLARLYAPAVTELARRIVAAEMGGSYLDFDPTPKGT